MFVVILIPLGRAGLRHPSSSSAGVRGLAVAERTFGGTLPAGIPLRQWLKTVTGPPRLAVERACSHGGNNGGKLCLREWRRVSHQESSG